MRELSTPGAAPAVMRHGEIDPSEGSGGERSWSDRDWTDPRAAHPGTRSGYLNVASIVRILYRRAALIALVVLLGVAAALFVVLRTTPVYSATATIIVKPDDANTNVAALPTAIVSPSQETAIETKVELLQSRNLAREVAATLRLADDPEFAPPRDARPGLLDRLLGWLNPPSVTAAVTPKAIERARNEAVVDRLIERLDVSRVARSSMINITASSADPRKAAQIANRVADTYIKSQMAESTDSRVATIDDLSARLAQSRDAAVAADREVAAFRKSHGLLVSQPELGAAASASQLAGLVGQTRADGIAEARRALAGGSATSPLLAGLREQEATLARRQSELTGFYGPGYPEVAKVNAEIAALRTRIDQESARIRTDLAAQAGASQARAAAMAASASGIRGAALAQGAAAVQLRELERRAETANALYSSVAALLNGKLSLDPQTKADIAVVSRAPIPDSPSSPLPKQALGIALLASAALGAVLALVVEMMDIKLRTAEQVERLLGVRTLAMVPDTRLEDGSGAASHDLVNQRPRSRFAEAMRNLLIELEGRRTSQSHVVVITSPLEAEGKNTIAKSLAATATRVDQRVVVVDFDLRRPELALGSAAPGEVPQTGVVAYLTGDASFDQLSVSHEGQPFASLGAGQAPLDPGALLSSPRLPRLIAQLREHYSLVILNAPPILPVRDAKMLADVADSTLLVLRWGKTDPEAARVAVQVFGRSITGAVINMVDVAAHAGRRYGDMIHHVARSSSYYDRAMPRRGWRRVSGGARRLAASAATTLHLN